MGLTGEESSYQCKRTRFDLCVRMIPWRRKWQSTLIFLPGKSHGQGRLPRGSQRVGHNLMTEHACAQSLYSMLNEKQNVFFIYRSYTVIYTKWAEGWYDGMKIFDNTHGSCYVISQLPNFPVFLTVWAPTKHIIGLIRNSLLLTYWTVLSYFDCCALFHT